MIFDVPAIFNGWPLNSLLVKNIPGARRSSSSDIGARNASKLIIHSSTMASSTSGDFHHYIPQFLLRNFAHRYKAKKSKAEQAGSNARIFPGNPVLNAVTLQGTEPEFHETLVKKKFGQENMYKDGVAPCPGKGGLAHARVEKKLGQFESAVSQVFSKIKEAHSNSQVDVHLSNSEHMRRVHHEVSQHAFLRSLQLPTPRGLQRDR
jgi:hypothetical protein